MVICAGFAGALQPHLKFGDMVVDLRGAESEWIEKAKAAAQKMGVSLSFGNIHSSDHVLSTPEKKKEVGEKWRACAVDMESEILKAWAQKKGANFIAVKVILDELHDSIPAEIPIGENPAALFQYALGHSANLPSLIRLYWRQRRGAQKLARFVENLLKG
ncbi:MAG: hypothetical protein HY400_04180 [Elusimicrobia bacterium]|nr:hypothetical protein [Elusimicrobiota bacterium]